MTTLKRQARAAEYRDLALAATALAEASGLDHVREKHERAAARWSELAALDEADAGPALSAQEALQDG
ncbi:MAG TPA: hypothetical protein VGL58_19055 [Caulobacteraceae bacterium]